MGCLKADKNDSSHYDSGALGVWAQGLALQIGSGGVLFFTGYNWGGISELEDLPNNLSLSSGWKMMEIFGIVHIVLAVVIAVCVLLTVFVSNCFKCLLYIINVVDSLYCLACTIVCGIYLYQGYHMANSIFENIWHPDDLEEVDTGSSNYQLYRLAKGRIMLGAVFSLAALAPFSRAPNTTASDSTAEVILYVNSLVLCLCVGATLVLPIDVYETIVIGAVGMGVATIVAALHGVLKCCSPAASASAIGVLFICIAIYSIIALIFIGMYYEAGRDITQTVAKPDTGGLEPYTLDMDKVADIPLEDRNYFLMYQCTDQGSFLLATIIMSFSLFIVSLFAGVYNLRFSCASSKES
eukprot:GHVS01074313.1.p1 GENE.GHVS01074313.1~~GHVS01074313.1.p1  ORF type:complete len:353 (+),score=49.14 GHVS01074313.1:192-1250(+)